MALRLKKAKTHVTYFIDVIYGADMHYYKENIEGEDSVTSANEWRLIGLMNLVGYGATGLFPNLVKEKETVDCLIEEYMLNLKKVK